jgi:hypothetical protein
VVNKQRIFRNSERIATRVILGALLGYWAVSTLYGACLDLFGQRSAADLVPCIRGTYCDAAADPSGEDGRRQ